MGDARRGGARASAPPAKMTRRQQKRAKRRANAQRAEERRAPQVQVQVEIQPAATRTTGPVARKAPLPIAVSGARPSAPPAPDASDRAAASPRLSPTPREQPPMRELAPHRAPTRATHSPLARLERDEPPAEVPHGEQGTLGRVAAKLRARLPTPLPRPPALRPQPAAPSATPSPSGDVQRPRTFRTLAHMASIAARGASEDADEDADRVGDDPDDDTLPDVAAIAPTSPVDAPEEPRGAGAGFLRTRRPPLVPRITAPHARIPASTGATGPRAAPITHRLGTRLDDLAHALPRVPASPPPARRPRRERPVRRPQPASAPDLLLPLASVYIALAAALALVSAALLLTDHPEGIWPLALAGILGAGGWATEFLLRRAPQALVGLALLAAHLAALAWILALIGAHAGLLALAAPLVLYTLRTVGRRAAALCAVLAGAVYVTMAVLAWLGVLTPPIHIDGLAAIIVDAVVAFTAALVALWLVIAQQEANERSEAAARGRLYELRALRAQLSDLRTREEESIAQLSEALERILLARPTEAPDLEGPFSPLAGVVDEIATRVETLRRDREDRLRMEGAVRRLTHVVERAWLGLPWAWPDASGTALDELVALLKTPSPQEVEPPALEETPTLIQLPTADRERRETPPMLAALRERVRTSVRAVPWLAASGTEGPRAKPMPPVRPVAATSTLPWHEWDVWREWEAAQDR